MHQPIRKIDGEHFAGVELHDSEEFDGTDYFGPGDDAEQGLTLRRSLRAGLPPACVIETGQDFVGISLTTEQASALAAELTTYLRDAVAFEQEVHADA